MLAAGLSLVLLAGFDDWKGSHTLDALRGRRIIYKPAVGINIPVVVVSGVGAPNSRQLTLYWIMIL